MSPKVNKVSKRDLNHDLFQGNEKSLADMILILSKNLKILLIIPTIFCFLTIIFVQFISIPKYTSISKIVVSSNNQNGFDSGGIAAQFGINFGTSKKKWAYSEIIKSRTIAKSMLKRSFDSKKHGKDKSLLHILNGNNDLSALKEVSTTKIADEFITMINVIEDIESSMYKIKITAQEAKLSADINNALIEEIGQYQKKYKKKKNSETKSFIKSRIIETEKELKLAEENLKNFNDQNRRIENSPSLQLDRQRLLREVSVLTGVFTSLKQQLETSKIEEVKDSDEIMILDQAEIPLFTSAPRKKNAVILAGFIGIGLAIIIIFLLEHIGNLSKKDKNNLKFAKSIIVKELLWFLDKMNWRKNSE